MLIVLDSSDLDRETITDYNFTVIATDTQGESATAVVTVTITDYNDNAPITINSG